MKNIIVGLITLFTFGLMAYLASTGTVFQGGEQGKVTKDMSTFEQTAVKTIQQTPLPEDKDAKEKAQLKALQDKA